MNSIECNITTVSKYVDDISNNLNDIQQTQNLHEMMLENLNNNTTRLSMIPKTEYSVLQKCQCDINVALTNILQLADIEEEILKRLISYTSILLRMSAQLPKDTINNIKDFCHSISILINSVSIRIGYIHQIGEKYYEC